MPESSVNCEVERLAWCYGDIEMRLTIPAERTLCCLGASGGSLGRERLRTYLLRSRIICSIKVISAVCAVMIASAIVLRPVCWASFRTRSDMCSASS